MTTVEIPGRHGGYYFGNKVRPRVFTLACYFEDELPAVWPRILHWLDRDRFGELAFDDRPGMSYMARPMEAIEPKAYIRDSYDRKTISGMFTVTLIAHDPFAKMDRISVDDLADLNANGGFLRDHTGLLTSGIMPKLDYSGAIGKTTELLLYNPGSERAGLMIEVAGDVGESGLLVVNRTTGQRCRIVKLTKALTTGAGATLIVDADHGRTKLQSNGASTLAFPYHDDGYIQLEGASPVDRDLVFHYAGGERKVRCDQVLRGDMIGKYIHLNARWVRIAALQDEHTASVDFTFLHSGTEISTVARMNEIILTTESGLTLDTLRFSYLPRYQ